LHFLLKNDQDENTILSDQINLSLLFQNIRYIERQMGRFEWISVKEYFFKETSKECVSIYRSNTVSVYRSAIDGWAWLQKPLQATLIGQVECQYVILNKQKNITKG